MITRASIRLSAGALLLLVMSQSYAADRIFANGFEERVGGGASGTDFVNDTGVGWCTDGTNIELPCPQSDLPGQDGERGRDALARDGQLPKIGGGVDGFDFTKIGTDGSPLLASATQWACVRDEVTGLTWELKKNDGGARDYRNRFSWYDPNSATNGGYAGSQGSTSTCDNTLGGAKCNTFEYAKYVNQQGMCGRYDWRVPTRRELLSIVRRGVESPRVDTNYFKPFYVNSINGPYAYWTSTPGADGGGAWWVDFAITGVSNKTSGSLNWIMLVRGGANP